MLRAARSGGRRCAPSTAPEAPAGTSRRRQTHRSRRRRGRAARRAACRRAAPLDHAGARAQVLAPFEDDALAGRTPVTAASSPLA